MMKLRHSMALGCVLVLLLICMPGAGAAEYSGTVNKDKVFFRMQPSTGSGYYDQFALGEAVAVLGISGDFYRVRSAGVEGYVMQQFITLPQGAKAALLGGRATLPPYHNRPGMEDIWGISDIEVPGATGRGDRGEDVKRLQQALTVAGFYNTTIDSDYGLQTEKAVKAFQESKNLTPDGIAGEDTIRALFEAEPAGEESVFDGTVPAASRRGDAGAHVEALQRALKEVGFYNTTIDGDFGYATEVAVKAFQRSRGLTPDGVAGNATLKALFGRSPAATAAPTPAPTKKPAAQAGSADLSAIPVPAPCARGDKGDHVKYLQQGLKAAGFYNTTIDGDYGYATVRAVKAFQKSRGLEEDGVAGEETIRSLFGRDASSAPATQKPAQPGMQGITEIDDIPVPAASRKGDSGAHVRALQQALALKGFYDGTIDGDFGLATELAVKAFQKSRGLSQDGVAGAVTIRGLFGKNPPSVATATPRPTATPVPQKGMEGIKDISDIAVPAASRPGDSGPQVKALQQALTLKGYYSSTIDGQYGTQTVNAVKAFQKSRGLSQDGVAGAVTIRGLFGKNPPSVATATPRPTATPKPQKGMEGITKISDIPVPATSKKGDRGADVKALQQALTLKGYYTSTIDSSYGENTVKAVKAFQKSRGLSQDGEAGAVTIRALFGKSPAKPAATATPKPTAAPVSYKTERLDWFNGGANKIPRGATFQVKDVATGKVFTVRRWAGANHIDAEPKTAADTAIMKSVYGGSWSWSRRAILVKYNGHVYAASMNGMPHGTTTISNNNFDGHFCIHFYQSKTHETKRVDPDHQNAVARAMRATW